MFKKSPKKQIQVNCLSNQFPARLVKESVPAAQFAGFVRKDGQAKDPGSQNMETTQQNRVLSTDSKLNCQPNLEKRLFGKKV